MRALVFLCLVSCAAPHLGATRAAVTVTDDTASLQARLNAGGVIDLAPGTYRVTDTLLGHSDTTILGHGRARIELDTARNVDALLFQSAANIRINGIEVDGRKDLKSDAVNTGRGIHFSQVTNGVIEDSYIHDTFEHCIRVGGGASADTIDTTAITVRGNTLKNCGNHANDRGFGVWAFWRVKDLVIADNTILDTQAGGIAVDDASTDATPGKECERVVVSGNVVRGSASDSAYERGIMIEGTRDFSVTGNTVAGHNFGIVVNDGQGQTDTGRGTIKGNTIKALREGMYLVDCRDLTVSENDLEHDGVAPSSNHLGVYGRGASRVLFRSNRVRGFYDGIYFDAASTTPVISSNLVESSVRYGIRVGAAGTLVRDNVTRASGTSGYLFDSAARVPATIWRANSSLSETTFSGTTTGPTYQ